MMANLKNSLHMVKQGKGGVGKSYVAVLTAQFLKAKTERLICADTDPVNATFTKYKSLDVAPVQIVEGGNILQAKFDPLMVSVLENEAAFVIDNGAATFLPLMHYSKANGLYAAIKESGKNVYIHTVLFGGSAKQDTYSGLMELIENVGDDAKIVVWENEREGKIDFDGLSIRDDKKFKEAVKAGKIAGIVNIADRRHDDTFTSAVKKMHERSMTLADVNASPDFNFFEKRRLGIVVREIFSDLDKVTW